MDVVTSSEGATKRKAERRKGFLLKLSSLCRRKVSPGASDIPRFMSVQPINGAGIPKVEAKHQISFQVPSVSLHCTQRMPDSDTPRTQGTILVYYSATLIKSHISSLYNYRTTSLGVSIT